MAFITSSVVSSSRRLTAAAIAQVIASHRVGFSKSRLQPPELMVDSLSTQTEFRNLRSPLVPFSARGITLFEQALVGLAYLSVDRCHRTHRILRKPSID